MSLSEIVALILGAYGAVISTILAIREISKERRKLKIILRMNVWVNVSLVLTNSGIRPVTIVDVAVNVLDGKSSKAIATFDRIFETLGNGQTPIFPFNLADGETKELYFSDEVSKILEKNNLNIHVVVTDSDQRKYTKYESQKYDHLFSEYTKLPKNRKSLKKSVD